LLRDFRHVLDAALDSGLSGPGRLHDLFVTHEAMSPGEWKNGGAGMTLRYGFHAPVRHAIAIASGRGCRPCVRRSGREQAALADMQRRWPRASYVEDRDGTPRWRSASSTRGSGARISRCAWSLIGMTSRCGYGRRC